MTSNASLSNTSNPPPPSPSIVSCRPARFTLETVRPRAAAAISARLRPAAVASGPGQRGGDPPRAQPAPAAASAPLPGPPPPGAAVAIIVGQEQRDRINLV
jgi:hypothetical protein